MLQHMTFLKIWTYFSEMSPSLDNGPVSTINKTGPVL
jgi:hypothetical protein